MIAIIDYGMGNLGSVFNMLKKIGVDSVISGSIDEIQKADKIILPGVGAFDAAIKKIDELGLRKVIADFVITKRKPLLGICLGMQLLLESSEEGILPGLGLIPGRVFHFKNHVVPGLKIPHMGWNTVSIANPSPLIIDFPEDSRFYFVHSYFVKVNDPAHSILKCNYGLEFDAAIQKDNIFGAQFHPEKSHKFGMKLLHNFASL